MGFLRAFKGRLNRVCENPYRISDFKIISQNYSQKDGCLSELVFEGEETLFEENIYTPQ